MEPLEYALLRDAGFVCAVRRSFSPSDSHGLASRGQPATCAIRSSKWLAGLVIVENTAALPQ